LLLAAPLLDRDTNAVVARGRLILSALLRIYADDIANGAWLPQCEREWEQLPASDALGRGALLTTGAVVALSHQQFAIAEKFSVQSIDALRYGSELLTIHGRLHLARSYFARGWIRAAKTAYSEALAIAAESVSIEPAGHTWARCFLAQIAFWQGDVDLARQHLHGILERLHGHDSYHDIYLCAFDTMWRIDASSGDLGAARKTIELAEATARQRHFPRLVELVPSWLVLLHVQRGDLAAAQRLARDHGLARMASAGLAHAYYWRTAYEAAMALGRLDIALKRSAAAAQRWQPFLDQARAYGMTFETAQLELMMACVELARGKRSEAGTLLGPVVAFAMREDARGLLILEGSTIANLLREISQDQDGTPWPSAVQEFVTSLSPPTQSRREHAHGLSAREAEVLLCACRGHSNKAISLSLMLSENTVKYHLKNVFRKLDVDSRLQAVDVARRCGLFAASDDMEEPVKQHGLSGTATPREARAR
jgi:LuxR family transcriptional regulator, maltose regulon positive regulatory protein